MNQCPECGQQRKADEYRCLACGCFYSQLDEILAEEARAAERISFKGRMKVVRESADPWQTFKQEWADVRQRMPRGAGLALSVIFMFVFALIVSVL